MNTRPTIDGDVFLPTAVAIRCSDAHAHRQSNPFLLGKRIGFPSKRFLLAAAEIHAASIPSQGGSRAKSAFLHRLRDQFPALIRPRRQFILCIEQ